MFSRTSDFDFNLLDELIAQAPSYPRDSCKLLVYDSASDKIYHRHFYNIVEYFSSGDVMVVNSSQVIPARILFNANRKKCEIDGTRDLKINVLDLDDFINKFGIVPLPPYIKHSDSLASDYQTVYANERVVLLPLLLGFTLLTP